MLHMEDQKHIPDQRTRVRLLPSFLLPGMLGDGRMLQSTRKGPCLVLCQQAKVRCADVFCGQQNHFSDECERLLGSSELSEG
jgi:hypothetical protein